MFLSLCCTIGELRGKKFDSRERRIKKEMPCLKAFLLLGRGISMRNSLVFILSL